MSKAINAQEISFHGIHATVCYHIKAITAWVMTEITYTYAMWMNFLHQFKTTCVFLWYISQPIYTTRENGHDYNIWHEMFWSHEKNHGHFHGICDAVFMAAMKHLWNFMTFHENGSWNVKIHRLKSMRFTISWWIHEYSVEISYLIICDIFTCLHLNSSNACHFEVQ